MNTYTNGEIDFENSWGNNACPQNVLNTWTVSFSHDFINLQNYSAMIFFPHLRNWGPSNFLSFKSTNK